MLESRNRVFEGSFQVIQGPALINYVNLDSILLGISNHFPYIVGDSTMSNVAISKHSPGISLDATLGAVQIGISLSLFLFGILSLQGYYYLEHHGGDGLYIKGFVSLSCSRFI
jgi:hypothetical protein